MKITPLYNRRLIKLSDDRKIGLIHLGAKRKINSTRQGIDEHSGDQVEVFGGGAPVGGNLVIVEKEYIVRINGQLQEPYIRIQSEEAKVSRIIDTIQDYFSGWYYVLEAYSSAQWIVGLRCLPFYGTPRLPLSDDSEYCHADSVAVVEEKESSDAK